MDIFNAGTVQAGFSVDTSGLKADMVTIENIFTKSSVISGKNYNAGFLGNLKAREIGNDMRIQVRTGLNASKLGKETAEELTGSFSRGTNGFISKINFGAVGLGIDIATLAFGAIKSSIEKARQEELAFKSTLDELNNSMISTNNFFTESARLTDLLGDASLSSAQKVALLNGEFVALEDRVNLAAVIESSETLKKLNVPIRDAQADLAKLKQKESFAAIDASITSQQDVSPGSKFEPQKLKKIRADIKLTEERLDQAIAKRDELVFNSKGSIAGKRLQIIAQAELDKMEAAQALRVAQLSGDKDAFDQASDNLFLENERLRLMAIGEKNFDRIAQKDWLISAVLESKVNYRRV